MKSAEKQVFNRFFALALLRFSFVQLDWNEEIHVFDDTGELL